MFTTWTVVDLSRACVKDTQAIVDDLCVGATSRFKGANYTCAQSSSGAVYLTRFGRDAHVTGGRGQRIEATDWTFGPKATAPRLGLPTASNEFSERCEALITAVAAAGKSSAVSCPPASAPGHSKTGL